MTRLIDAEALYEQIVKKEELARQRVLDTPSRMPNGNFNPSAVRYATQLDERTQMKFMITDAPTVEPTLYGYNIEHLALVARVMQKDGVTPEKAVQIFKDVQTISMKVIDEINGAVERAFEQVTEVRGSGDGKAD